MAVERKHSYLAGRAHQRIRARLWVKGHPGALRRGRDGVKTQKQSVVVVQ